MLAGETKELPVTGTGRLVWFGAIVGLAVIVAGSWTILLRAGFALPPLGIDRTTYHDAIARFLSAGPFYNPDQLTGPYELWGNGQPILYPPTAIPLLTATLLPAVLWWVIPLGVLGAVIAWHRPRWEAVAIIGLLVVWPTTLVSVLWVGNPAMWIVAILALATRWSAFGSWVLLKPSLTPFALWGVRSRGWWLGLVAFAAVSLAFLPLWADYLTALRNAPVGLGYSLGNVPLMLIPVVASLGRGGAEGDGERGGRRRDLDSERGGRAVGIAGGGDGRRPG